MLAAGQIFLSVTNKADLQPEALMKFLLPGIPYCRGDRT